MKVDVDGRASHAEFVERLASGLLECFINCFVDAFDCDALMESHLQDRLLRGGGVARVLYVSHFSDEIEHDCKRAVSYTTVCVVML
ncbi:MAG TPA: hypothetical protein VGJ20_37795 [Xanthobacteraceae bacterium]